MHKTYYWKIRRRIVYLLINLIRYVDGNIAMRTRIFLYKKISMKMGNNVVISPAVQILSPECLSMGNSISIHEFCYFSCDGGIEIGNDVSIAHNCSFLTGSHIYNNPSYVIRDSGVTFNKIIIGNNVWFGCGVRVLSGSIISDGVVVGANTVVKGYLPPNTVCAGIPAVVKKGRFDS